MKKEEDKVLAHPLIPPVTGKESISPPHVSYKVKAQRSIQGGNYDYSISYLRNIMLDMPDKLCKQYAKIEKYVGVLSQSRVDIDELRGLGWSGVPEPVRPLVWGLLSVSNVIYI